MAKPPKHISSIAQRMITCIVIVALMLLSLPRPSAARYASAGHDMSIDVKKAVIPVVAAAAAVIIFVIVISHVHHNPKPKLVLEPKQIDFGSMHIGASGKQTVDLRNRGKASLVIDEISVSGDCYSIEQRPETLPLILTQSDQVQVIVGFTIKEKGVCRGSLRVKSQENKSRTFELPLEVRGI